MPSPRAKLVRCIVVLSGAALSLVIAACAVWAAGADKPAQPETVGAIEGDFISVQGPMNVDSANGQIRTVLRSGSDVVVKSGQAHIDLVEGGNITICGPAHFSLLKSSGALTLALDHGTIHAHIEGSLTLNVYTPLIQAHPIAIGNSEQDLLVGLTSAGAMCFRPTKGAMRIEQQLTGQSLVIPQNGDVSLANGQLESLQNSPGHCACELQVSTKPALSIQVSALATPDDLKKRAAEPKPTAPPQSSSNTEEPIYQVFMPPLRYNAGAKVEQEFDPKLILLVRRARVRPTLIFQGKVEGDPVVAQATLPQPPPLAQKPEDAKKPADYSTWNRVRSFFHKLWSPSS